MLNLKGDGNIIMFIIPPTKNKLQLLIQKLNDSFSLLIQLHKLIKTYQSHMLKMAFKNLLV